MSVKNIDSNSHNRIAENSEAETPSAPNMVLRLKAIERLQVFRYLVAAGTATLVDVLCFTLLIGLLIGSQANEESSALFYVGGVGIGKKFFAITISYTFGLITNFLITKFYVFRSSMLSTSTQFTRFTLVALVVFVANYYLTDWLYTVLPLGVETGKQLRAFLARGFSAACIAVLSFIAHKLFSFEAK